VNSKPDITVTDEQLSRKYPLCGFCGGPCSHLVLFLDKDLARCEDCVPWFRISLNLSYVIYQASRGANHETLLKIKNDFKLAEAFAKKLRGKHVLWHEFQLTVPS